MSGSPFAAQVRSTAESAVIDLEGDVDRNSGPALETAYTGAVTDRPPTVPVVLNFERVGYINSTGIAVIVTILARARSEGRAVRAFGLSEHYREIFSITRLADFMSIYDTEPQALATT